MNKPSSTFTDSILKPITRRNLLQGASATALAGFLGNNSLAHSTANAQLTPAAAPKAFPAKFLWG
jgi:hypothetical protein